MINYRIIGSIKIIVINVALIAGLSFSFRTGGSEFRNEEECTYQTIKFWK
jgi:hypothetical protein